MNRKKIFTTAVLAAFMAATVQVSQPATAEAGFLDNLTSKIGGPAGDLINGLAKKALKLNPEDIQNTYYDMVQSYYAAAYYSNRAAIRGSELLSYCGEEVETSEGALCNASTDSSATDTELSNLKDKQIITIKTSIKDAKSFAKKIEASNDPKAKELAIAFAKNCEFRDACLKDGNSALVTLIGKQALAGDAGDAVKQCIAAAVQYQAIRKSFEQQTGTTVSKLGKEIKDRFKVKVSKDDIKNAKNSVSRG